MKRAAARTVSILVVLLAGLVVVTPARAGDPCRVDGETPLETVRQAAETGDATAQIRLSHRLKNGTGVEADPVAARRWARAAAEQGLACAQRSLGGMLMSGQGVARDPAQALEWLRKAVAQGDPQGLNNLAVMYWKGNGVPKDTAQAAMGEMRQHGNGVPKDEVRALMWYLLAENRGHARVAPSVRALESRLPPDKVAEARRLAREWRSK